MQAVPQEKFHDFFSSGHVLPAELSAWPPPQSMAMRGTVWICQVAIKALVTGDLFQDHDEQLKYFTCAHWASHFMKMALTKFTKK